MAPTDLSELVRGADRKDTTTSAITSPAQLVGPAPMERGYLETFNLFRVVACAAVLGQHSFIWANMSGNFIGTAFITMLHLSRNSFFFLTGLVVTYAQITHPRSLGGFWKRRYWEIGIPYLAWTFIYLVFSLITVDSSWNEVGRFLRHTVFLGFSQMYFVIVIFQFYFVFPFLLKLLRSTSHHVWVMASSLAFATFLGLVEHYDGWIPPAQHVLHSINSVLPLSRDVLAYQEFLVAGVLVALHLDQVLAFVGRHYRQMLAVAGVAGILEVIWYAVEVRMGATVEKASDIYQPFAALWCLAAIGGIFALSWWWEQRARFAPRAGRDTRGRTVPTTAYLAGLTGGVFFAHTLFINMIRSVLDETGLRTSLPWGAIVAILFVGTVTVTTTFSAMVQRTPMRWVLGGPLRAQQRAEYNAPDGIVMARSFDAPPGSNHHPDMQRAREVSGLP